MERTWALNFHEENSNYVVSIRERQYTYSFCANNLARDIRSISTVDDKSSGGGCGVCVRVGAVVTLYDCGLLQRPRGLNGSVLGPPSEKEEEEESISLTFHCHVLPSCQEVYSGL